MKITGKGIFAHQHGTRDATIVQFLRGKFDDPATRSSDPNYPHPLDDEDGKFGGCLWDAKVVALYAVYAEVIADALTDEEVPDDEIDHVELLASRDATGASVHQLAGLRYHT